MTDRFTVRVVVATLAASVLGGLAAMAYLAMTQTPIPDQLDRLVNFLAGGLAGVLVSTRSTGDPAQPVEIVNNEDQPVPVDQH